MPVFERLTICDQAVERIQDISLIQAQIDVMLWSG